MIREERDPAFWEAIVSHPAVEKVKFGHTIDVGAVVQSERVTPLASDHGGFLFIALDGPARVLELHTMFTPEGWGKEVAGAAKLAFEQVFRTADLVTTYQTEDSQSRPPLSYGWRPVGDFQPNAIGLMRLWLLTKEAWLASPAWRRRCR